MSDAFRIAPHPDLEDYRKLAQDLKRACDSGEAAQVGAWAAQWARTLARLEGRKMTPDLEREIEREEKRIASDWQRQRQSDERAARCTLADAQSFVARVHGFTDWPAFSGHIESLGRADSPVSAFESAADAIVEGDATRLGELLATHAGLVWARSTREHRSTLLHYVSANGVEDFRQKTPPNIVEIAGMLLDGGADINAESEAYGGGSTALGLAATSCHPEAAGVQIELLEMLIARGATLDTGDRSIVNACLHNGRGIAAEFLAGRGARLDLEGAAGVGRLELVQSFFNEDGGLTPRATEEEMRNGFAWACEFGRTAVVEFLLDHVPVELRVRHHGQTGLHWAAYGGHADTVRLLLGRGAPVNAKDEAFDGTPLEWAIYQWGNSPKSAGRGSYYEVVAILVQAGGTLDPNWSGDDRERIRAMQRAASDGRMQAALRGETGRG
jgi:ankyrin repeat protein